MGLAKVSWVQICRPLEEGGLGDPDIAAVNRALMCKHLCELVVNPSSIWAQWIAHYRLRNKSLWTMSMRSGTWSWRKIVKLRMFLLQLIGYKVGNGNKFLLWHDPWSSKGPLIHQFPRAPLLTGLPENSPLNMIIRNGEWNWPATMRHSGELLNYIGSMPLIHLGDDQILWRNTRGKFITSRCIQTIYATDTQGGMECSPTRTIQNTEAAAKWRGKHCINAAYKALLAATVYHVWRERNARRFQQTSQTPMQIAEHVKQRILRENVPFSLQSSVQYRLWSIPWSSGIDR
ncbi:UNVERIFIED_CONTAM: hypothetical protein Slati_3981600 [Sesamum latifolium]|uniref:Reverse transcriptase zinc-binding domain-containing protein n=1 Tax=Sesamum latifolium TaxID=2727402 RepID=A0AAW2TPY8_9LAMI